ncbi:serine hydrolase domain-containing protein [Psychroserpens luteolus]|uniref:serine hydrolase domain-containing protein n=1 Tax=Psychroserpens luteolus TaxID=2855840 RepID=UPI001E572ACA|nr:serine hydrolase domain-containing protein [Psychroserpens luteolus]MCD2259130.1 beta-lactamase family protein [Psychroserpens luteolus]
MRLLCFVMTLCLITSCEGQKKNENKVLEDRISRIENGLQSRLQIQYNDSTIKSIYNIEERMQELKVPGLSIAVLNNGVIEWDKGYGIADSLENRKVTTKTLFQAGSISKVVAATRALQLAEQSLIDLDLNVNTYLSSWKLPENEFTENQKVTTRRILNHTAGLTISGFKGYKKGETIPSIPKILDGKGNTNPVRVYKEPGKSWSYSGGGYTIMQHMITDIEQKQFPEIMMENVLKPLGMTSSTFKNPLPQAYHNIAAAGYNFDGTQVEGKWWIYPEMAAAGLWTTPSELLVWAKEIQQILQTQKDGLLQVNTVSEMLTPNEDDQGLGPYVLDLTFGHGGADEGFRADLVVWKKTPNAVVIMTNSQNGNTIIRELLLSIVHEYNLPGYTPTKRVFKEQSQEQLARFIGTYDFLEKGIANMTVKGDGLEFTGELFSKPIFLWPESDTTFFNKKTGTRYKFTLKNGAVKGVKFSRFEGKKLSH